MFPRPQHGRGAGVQLSVFCVCEIALPPRLQLLGSEKVSAWEPGGHARTLGTEVGLVPGAQICCVNSGDSWLEFASFLCVPASPVYEHKYFPLVYSFQTYVFLRYPGTFHTTKTWAFW